MALRIALAAAFVASVGAVTPLRLSDPQMLTITPGGSLSCRFDYLSAAPHSLVFDVVPVPATMSLHGLNFNVTNTVDSRVQEASSLSVYIENTQFAVGNAHFQMDVVLDNSVAAPVNFMAVVYEAGVNGEFPSYTRTDTVSAGASWRGEVYVKYAIGPDLRTSAGFNVLVPPKADVGKLVTLSPGPFAESNIVPELEVRDSQGKNHPLKKNGNRNYTFTVMESTDFTVSWVNGLSSPCPFREDTGKEDTQLCNDGSECNAAEEASCCSSHGGIKKCMKGYNMCSTAGACDGDYCCSDKCASLGQYIRPCGAPFRVDINEVSLPVNGGSGGLSGGGVFLVLFFTVSLTYFVFGAAFKYSNGARGFPEILPNYRFWMELPKLMSEGVEFLKSKVVGTHQGYAVYSDQYAPAPFETEQRSGFAKQGAGGQGYGTENL